MYLLRFDLTDNLTRLEIVLRSMTEFDPLPPLSFALAKTATPRLRSLRQRRSNGANGQLQPVSVNAQIPRKRSELRIRRSSEHCGTGNRQEDVRRD